MKMNPFTLGGTALGMVTSELSNLVSGSDDYNVYDEFVDVLYNVADFNLAGIGKQEEFKLTGGAEGYARLAADMLPFTLGIIAEAKRGDITGIKKIIGNTIGGKTGRLNGLSSKLKNEILVADAAFKVTALDNLKEAETLGLEGGSAKTYAFTKSLATAITSAKIGIEGKITAPTFTKSTLSTFANTLKSAATGNAMKVAANNFLKTTSGELLQEETEFVIDLGVKSAFALALPGYENSVQQQKELIAGTLMLSGGFGGARAITDFNINKKRLYADVIKQSNDLLESFDVLLKETKDTKSKEQLEKAKQFTVDIIRAAKISPENVTPEQLELLTEKQELLREKQNTDSAFHVEINKKIKEIDEKINEGEVAKGKEDVQKKIIKGVEKYGEKLGTSTDYFNQQEVDDFIDSLDDKQKNKYKQSNAGKQLGFFYSKEDGSTGFVINVDVAASKGNITSSAHEMVHVILNETLMNNPEAAQSLGIALTRELAKIDLKNINNSEFAKRLSGYLKDAEDGKISDADAWEEALTLFSEASLTGDIVYDNSVGSQIKDIFNRILKDLGIQKEFNDGRDVYNFIKGYNKSLIKGEVDKRIIKGAKKGFKGKLVEKPKIESTDKTRLGFSKAESSRVDNLVGPKTDGKYTMTKTQWDAGGLNAAYNDLILGTGLDALIGKGIFGSEVQGVSRDQFKQNVKDRLTDELLRFNPEVNNSLSGFINSRLGFRKGDELKKLKKTKAASLDDETSSGKSFVSNIADTTAAPETATAKTPVSKLRRIVGTDIASGQEVARTILKGKLPATTDRKIKSAINKRAREEYLDDVKALIDDTFLEEKAVDIINTLSIQDVVKLERGSKDKILAKIVAKNLGPIAVDKAIAEGKLAKETNRTSGPNLYERLPIDKTKLIEFLKPRKIAFAGVIAENLAKDAIPGVMSEPDTQQRRRNVEEAQGRKTDETDKVKVSSAIDRAVSYTHLTLPTKRKV